MNKDDMRNIKIDLKCSELVQELETRGHVEVTYNEKGQEFITITKEGLKWFDKTTKMFKASGILPQDFRR